jgi:phosphate transport system protein
VDRPHPIVEKKLAALREKLLRMGGLAEAILDKSLRALSERDADLAREVAGDDLAIDRLDVEIDRSVLELLALQSPVAHDLRQTIAIKTAALDLERVGDLARNIANSAVRLAQGSTVRVPPGLLTLADETQRILSAALTAFADTDPDKARSVLAADDQIDADEATVIRNAIDTIQTTPERSSAAVDFILVAKSLERVGDHATNIAEDVVMAAESVNLKHAEKIHA